MKTKRNITKTATFELVIDNMYLFVTATSFLTYTLETHYRVSVNGSPVYIFGWHPVLKRITTIDRGSAANNISYKILDAIAEQLTSQMTP